MNYYGNYTETETGRYAQFDTHVGNLIIDNTPAELTSLEIQAALPDDVLLCGIYFTHVRINPITFEPFREYRLRVQHLNNASSVQEAIDNITRATVALKAWSLTPEQAKQLLERMENLMNQIIGATR